MFCEALVDNTYFCKLNLNTFISAVFCWTLYSYQPTRSLEHVSTLWEVSEVTGYIFIVFFDLTMASLNM